MIRLIAKKTRDVRYYLDDRALELDGVRIGGPGRWLRGDGDLTSERHVRRTLVGTPRSEVVGYDLIVAAPRPASSLLALGSLDEQRGVVVAHQRAVASALDYLEDRALVVRRTVLGEREELAARWRFVAAFTHGVNRRAEPHLHDHVIVPARAAGVERVIDGRALYVHLGAADAIYRSELRLGIARDVGRASWRSFRGIEHVEGVNEGVRALWPGHGGRGAEKRSWQREAIVEVWRSDLDRLEDIALPLPPRVTERKLQEHVFSSHFEGSVSIRRRNVVEAAANAAVRGATRRELENLINHSYPSLAHDRGLAEQTVSLHDVRQVSRIKERGARPLDVREFDAWNYRERSLEMPTTSRNRSSR